MMPLDDPSDPSAETRRLKKRVERLEAGTADGDATDGDHPGSGFASTQVGDSAVASGSQSLAVGFRAESSGGFGALAVGADAIATHDRAVAVGPGTTAYQAEGVALGYRAAAWGLRSVAIGGDATANNADSVAIGANITCNTDWRILLGSSAHTVYVPGNLTVVGTFSNPSARRLKRDITPAPYLPAVFPELVEYAYIEGDGQRRLGYIADDLVGTDAERFVQFDADGNPEAIDYLGLMVAQNAQLQARLTVLENLIEGLTNG
jgi:hypothetical protein